MSTGVRGSEAGLTSDSDELSGGELNSAEITSTIGTIWGVTIDFKVFVVADINRLGKLSSRLGSSAGGGGAGIVPTDNKLAASRQGSLIQCLHHTLLSF